MHIFQHYLKFYLKYLEFENFVSDLKKEFEPKIEISYGINKPFGKDVLWACRIFRKSLHYSWLDWCYGEEFNLKTYRPETRRIFELSDNANILVLNGWSGIKKLLSNPNLLKDDENLTINYGRLGEEAVKIKEIVKEADANTLILFNETYSTTSAQDGLYLSKDLLKILKETGSALIFNTHIHEVARSIDEINTWPGESDCVSLVMEIKNNVNTFKVKRSEPDSKSYARNIAEKYGITYEQMKEDKSNYFLPHKMTK